MHRVLFVIPIGNGLPVFGYGLFLMLGFIVGLTYAWHRAKKAGLSGDAALDVGLITIFAGVVGARLAFLLLDYTPTDGDYGSPLEWLAVWQGGLTFQGGLFLALAAGALYLHWKRIPFGKMFDVFAPPLALGVGFGRLGCLLNGCCWGKPSPAWFPFGMVFPLDIEPMVQQFELWSGWPEHWDALLASLGYPAGTVPPIPLYPTQIVSAVGLFLIALGLVWAERRYRPLPDGTIGAWFLVAYGAGRFLIELLRDDTPLRYGFGPFPGLRLGQWLALAMIVGGIALLVRIARRKPGAEA